MELCIKNLSSFFTKMKLSGHNLTPNAHVAPRPCCLPLSRLSDSFLYGISSKYLEELQKARDADPTSVDESWEIFFKNYIGQTPSFPEISTKLIEENMSLMLLARAYQVNGHMEAKFYPLGLGQRQIPQELDPAHYGFTEPDLDRQFFRGVWKISRLLSYQTVRSILASLNRLTMVVLGMNTCILQTKRNAKT